MREAWPLPPLGSQWQALIEFAAAYYQRGAGEVALGALPPELRQLSAAQLARRLKRLHKGLDAATEGQAPASPAPALSADQSAVLAALSTLGLKARTCCGAPPAAARPRST